MVLSSPKIVSYNSMRRVDCKFYRNLKTLCTFSYSPEELLFLIIFGTKLNKLSPPPCTLSIFVFFRRTLKPRL